MDEMGFQGGRGSCLAVTAQYVGADGKWWTDDDVYDADLNAEPAFVSADMAAGDGEESALDRVRPFMSAHPGGAVFSHVDGSTHFVNQDVERRAYVVRSHISSGEVLDQ
jgi:hypothetical protein